MTDPRGRGASGAHNGIYFYTDDRSDTPWGPRYNYSSADVAQCKVLAAGWRNWHALLRMPHP